MATLLVPLLPVAVVALVMVALAAGWCLASRRRARAGQRAALHGAQQRYRAVVEQAPDAIVLAEQGVLSLVNPACVALFGAREPADLLGRPLIDLLPDWPQALQPVARVASGAGSGTPPMFEHTVRRLDGSVREVEIWVADVPAQGVDTVQLMIRDIGDRRRIERIRRDRERLLLQLDRIARTVPGVIGEWVLRPDGSAAMPYASGVFEAQCGLRPGDVARDLTPLLLRLHPDDRGPFADRVHASARELSPFHHEWRYLHPARGERWFEGRAMPHRRSDGTVVWHGVVMDVSDRHRAIEGLMHSREELRRLSDGLTAAREAERRHISRELHDELGQRLSAIKLEIGAALRSASPDDDDLRGRLRHLQQSVDVTVSSVRRIASDLRPSMLDDLGLQAALDWLVRDGAARSGIDITLDGDAFDSPLTDAASTTVYRIVQEALTNIARHAGARSAHVELRSEGEDLQVVVLDDGVGLAPGDVDKRASLGLMGIRERARMLGGRATIGNGPHGGCRLEVRLPLDRVVAEPVPLESPA